MYMTKRCFVRIISFAIAIIAVLGIAAVKSMNNENALKMQLQYNMARSVEDLSASLDNITNTLDKGIYSGTPEMMSFLSSKLWSDSANAKITLSQLPVAELHLENTYKFLSQAGNYAKSLSQRYSEGETLTEEDRENLRKLSEYAKTLSDNMWRVRNRIENGELSYEKTSANIQEAGNDNQPQYITDGFADFELGYDNYPTLIYDGPFSDHILEKEPQMIKNKKEISVTVAQNIAEKASGKTGLIHSEIGDEKGKMPCFVFEKDNTTVAVTQNGGYLCYMTNYRKVNERSISAENAVEKAQEFLDYMGITELTDTYYEIGENVCTINFAGVKSGVVLYTDLIKVSVAMDNGEILAADCRGYLVNHIERLISSPKITKSQAMEFVSDELDINGTKLCIIPAESTNERYCYEFSCTASDGRQILVYINADTGYEEQILLLKISENGTLTV